jgi:hypothetical protein
MNLPDDLPFMIDYLVGKVVLTTLPRRPVSPISTSGDTDAKIVRPQIPYGTTAWRRTGETVWRSLSAIPKHWLPFLDRQRGTEWDCRPAR